MNKPEVLSPRLTVQLEKARKHLISYRRSMAQYPSVAERIEVTNLLRASMEPEGVMGVNQNQELWRLVDEFDNDPDSEDLRDYAGAHAASRVEALLRRSWRPPLDAKELAQVAGEARAVKVLADLSFYRKYFGEYLGDIPFDPCAGEDGRLHGDDQAGTDTTIHLAQAWVIANRAGDTLARVEGAVAGRRDHGGPQL